MRRTIIITAAVLAATPALAAAQDEFSWSGRVEPGRTVEIKGVSGNIQAMAASGGEVEVRATKRARRSDPEEVRIEVIEHAGGVTICAVYPTPARARQENECAPGEGGRMSTEDNDVSVNFVVRVPEGVRLAAGTVNGSVEVSGLRSDVEASSVNGSVEVETTGSAIGQSVNGAVELAMGRADWDGERRASSVNGSVTVVLPADANVDVSGSTVNGGIESDFPITVRGRWGPRSLRGTIGSGGRDLHLETVNGEIRIRRGG